MQTIVAFDVYGTLIDTHGVVTELQSMVGDKAQSFSNTWRDKQLEYSFRRGLMQNYEPFSVCTRQALDYTCSFYGMDLSEEQRNVLLNYYGSLPAFSDVKSSLSKLKGRNFRLFAFSNGTPEAVSSLLNNAGIRELFEDVVSVDDIKSFKPNPAVYSLFLRKAAAPSNRTWLVSSNPFDVIGAISFGMRAAWVQRSKQAVFDPWGIEPTITLSTLNDLNQELAD